MDVSQFVRENYYGGDMEAGEILAAVLVNGDQESRNFVRKNYYQGNMEIEELMAAL
jgi:hypothetical protein